MKKPFLKLTVLLITLCVSATSLAQDFQGKAYYMSKTTMDLDQFGGREMTPDRKKQIEERMKSFLEKQYILTFNKEESIYKEDEKLEAATGGGRGFGGFASSFTGGPKYKNVKSKELLQDQEFFGKQFLIKDSIFQRFGLGKWESETKKIGHYTCVSKLLAVKPIIDEMDFSKHRRRRGKKKDDEGKKKDSTETSNDPMKDIEIPKETVVTAWYTMQIPVSQGPG